MIFLVYLSFLASYFCIRKEALQFVISRLSHDWHVYVNSAGLQIDFGILF